MKRKIFSGVHKKAEIYTPAQQTNKQMVCATALLLLLKGTAIEEKCTTEIFQTKTNKKH